MDSLPLDLWKSREKGQCPVCGNRHAAFVPTAGDSDIHFWRNEMAEKKLRIEEVAIAVGSSAQTINNWYRWKKLNPEHELAKLLPDYEQEVEGISVRLWDINDIWKIKEFKSARPRGCKGVLGEITQKYLRNRKEN